MAENREAVLAVFERVAAGAIEPPPVQRLVGQGRRRALRRRIFQVGSAVGVATAAVVVLVVSFVSPSDTALVSMGRPPAGSCQAVAASRTQHLAPPAQERLTETIHAFSLTLRPPPAGYRPPTTSAQAWRHTDFIKERRGNYSIFLARVWSPMMSSLKGPYFTGQVFWIIRAQNLAGPDDLAPPADYRNPSTTAAPKACIFYGTGYDILSTQTGELLVGSG